MKRQMEQNVIPLRFRAVFGDQAVFGMRMFFDGQLHCFISFSGRIDAQRLARAVRLTLDAEPILGCCFVERWWRPYWERRPDLDRVELLQLVETTGYEKELIQFMVTPTNPSEEPVVRCLILRAETDTLCIKMDHMVADAGGVKEYAYLLASIYRELSDNPGYTVQPNLNGRRSMRQVGERFSFTDKLSIVRRGLQDQKSLFFPRAYWAFPSRAAEPLGRTYAIRQIGSEQFRAIKRLGEKYRATINDIILTAIFRALFEIIQPPPETPLRLTSTVDLRRYLPSRKAEALCNLSSFSYPNIGRELGARFEDTLVKVRDDMNARKADFAGLGDLPLGMAIFKGLPFAWAAAIFQRAWGQMIRTGILPPDITNMGIIDSEKLTFGDVSATHAFLTPGVTFSPFFGMGVSGYQESLTLSVGFCQNAIQISLIESFLSQMVSELPG